MSFLKIPEDLQTASNPLMKSLDYLKHDESYDSLVLLTDEELTGSTD